MWSNIYIYIRTCKLRHILVVRTCWWIDPNAIHHSKCLPTYQSPLLLFESDITKLIIIYRMNRRCEIYVSRIRHFHGTSRKVTCNQRTLALISLFHPSSNGMMFGTLVPFGFARATFDIVSSVIEIRILVLVIVVGAAHVCGMRHTGIYRYMRHTQHTHTLFLPAQLLSNHVSKSFERRLLLAGTASIHRIGTHINWCVMTTFCCTSLLSEISINRS